MTNLRGDISMSLKVSAREMGSQWLAFVTEVFGLENGAFRPEVGEEFKKLEVKDAITQERELWRNYTDELIEKIMQCESADERHALIAATDTRSLCFVQDRIHCGTELLTIFAQKDLQLDLGEIESIQDYFKLILLQRQA
jgi:hypothetical protein